MIETIRKARTHADKISVLENGKRHTYRTVISRAEKIAALLLGERKDLEEDRVSFMVTPGVDYVATLWGIWQAGGVAVPLCLSHPPPSLKYVLEDAGSQAVIASAEFEKLLSPLCRERGAQLIVLHPDLNTKEITLPHVASERRALILYTSGTTNLPKGVVTTHRNLEVQITTLVNAWGWSDRDHILCVLPLHHVHGIINVVSCSLWAGACCEFMPDFSANAVLEIFQRGEINVFMAVPTIYFKLIAAWEGLPPPMQLSAGKAMSEFRLMVSGSAALPVSVMNKWENITGQRLLERYGMTELGMAISNPYQGERRAGFVGLPLRGVSVRLCDEDDQQVEGEPGEIQVRGENVFLEYWRQPDVTEKSFTKDGWFKTGDIGTIENGYYRILGRNSVDIIKSGGYKISALEIEEVLRTHPMVGDCAVVGLEDEEWGEVVAAVLVLRKEAVGGLSEVEVRTWLKERLPAYRVPKKFLMVDDLPRNAMEKVTKNEVKKLFV